MSAEGRVGPRGEMGGLSPEAVWEEQFQPWDQSR